MESGNERLDKAHDRLLETGWWELEFGESYQPSDDEILATYEELEDDIERYRFDADNFAKRANKILNSRRLQFKQLDAKAQERALSDYLEGLQESNPTFSFLVFDGVVDEYRGVVELQAMDLESAKDFMDDSYIKSVAESYELVKGPKLIPPEGTDIYGSLPIIRIPSREIDDEFKYGRTKGEIRTDLETEMDDLYAPNGELTVVIGDPILPPGEELVKALRDYSKEKMTDANTDGKYSDVEDRKLMIAEAVAYEEAANKVELRMSKRRVKKQLNRFKEKYPNHPLLGLMPSSEQLESDILTRLGYEPHQQVEALERMLTIMNTEGVETIDPTFDRINFQLWFNQSENKMGPVNETDYGKLPLKRNAAGNEWMRWYSDADGLDRLMKASERGESYIAYKHPNVRHVGTPNTSLSKSNFKFSRTYKDKWGRKRRYVSKSPGKGLVIWNNQELARLAAIRGRANGNWVRTIPVKEGWVNIAAPMKDDEYYVGTKNIPRTSFPSRKNLPKSVRREYFRRD